MTVSVVIENKLMSQCITLKVKAQNLSRNLFNLENYSPQYFLVIWYIAMYQAKDLQILIYQCNEL